MADINATTPVVAPAVGSVTFDKWFMTQIIGKIDDKKAPVTISLRRAAKTESGWDLMPVDKNSDVTFTVDVFKESVNTPELAAAMEAVLNAVIAYGTKKGLL